MNNSLSRGKKEIILGIIEIQKYEKMLEFIPILIMKQIGV
jgi:hypothetical protein